MHHYSQPLPARRTYFPGGPRIFPPSLPSTAMSSPFATPINPFLPPVRPTSTVVSSPSHHPIPLPIRRRPRTLSKLKVRKGHPPPRVASTLPPSSDTVDDVSNDEEDEGDLTEGRVQPSIATGEEDEESDVWINEDKDDRLDVEYHPSHISSVAKRRRRFQEKWEELVGLFKILDRDTDATMLLFAAQHDISPPNTQVLASRAIRRTPALMASAIKHALHFLTYRQVADVSS
ncbi:hypothetical protein BS47DRAFT_48231 [Hydnum rufescens UP504]|uniref:Uncharacterized protein n=1 Tax=Hydnum rufescens UP504 TaxID=1448309 RepID=A0A9P6DR59_9AGAM|nr:hypothetical protein BS47DRAFT_48231 [Hydnum rufescens UP504]